VNKGRYASGGGPDQECGKGRDMRIDARKQEKSRGRGARAVEAPAVKLPSTVISGKSWIRKVMNTPMAIKE